MVEEHALYDFSPLKFTEACFMHSCTICSGVPRAVEDNAYLLSLSEKLYALEFPWDLKKLW